MKKIALFWLTLLLMGALVGCKEGIKAVVKEKEQVVIRDYAVNSSNMVMNKVGDTIYIANIDVNTVTIVDSQTKKVKAEIPVGKSLFS